MLSYKKSEFAPDILEEINSFFEYLESRELAFCVPNVQTIKMWVGYIKLLAGYFKKIFKKAGTRLVFGSNYYGFVEMAANLACKELGILSVDIQHGVQGEFHAAYGNWKKLPAEGYEVFPSVFWNWSKHEQETILRWNRDVVQYHRTIVGGNPIIALFNEKNNPVVQPFEKKIERLLDNRIEFKKQVLMTLSWEDRLPSLCVHAMQRTAADFFWWIRPHPKLSANKYNNLINELRSMEMDNFNIQDANQLPLYTLLRHMDVHVTEASSTVIEAEQYGVPSILIHTSGKTFFDRQMESGIATFADTCEKLIEAIQNSVIRKSTTDQSNMVIVNSALNSLITVSEKNYRSFN